MTGQECFEPRRAVGEAEALDGDARGKRAEETRGQAAVENDEHAAVGGAADQAAIGLAQPPPCQPFIPLLTTER